jgi:hypothetical protein
MNWPKWAIEILQIVDDDPNVGSPGSSNTQLGGFYRTEAVLSRLSRGDMNASKEIRPFRLDICGAEIDGLHRRLDETRWPQPLPGDDWDTGVPVAWLH